MYVHTCIIVYMYVHIVCVRVLQLYFEKLLLYERNVFDEVISCTVYLL